MNRTYFLLPTGHVAVALSILLILSFSPLFGQCLKDYPGTLLLEAEGFATKGGWVVDQQYMDQVGSPVLLAHGVGVPVADAVTKTVFPKKGNYRVYVRTRNWVAPWSPNEAPGRFQIIINGTTLPTEFGTTGSPWAWQKGSTDITIKKDGQEVEIKLHDLTGFAGRVDAICFSSDAGFIPPNSVADLAPLRRQALNLPETVPDAPGGPFDLVVVGGGVPGICSSITAARLGLKVALIQDRPVLGGNASSEIRVGLAGHISQEPYPNLGNLVAQLQPVRRSSSIYGMKWEDHPLKLVQAEKNIHLFLNTHMNDVATEKGRKGIVIQSVVAQNIITGERLRFKGKLFADCTGDASLGYRAGADWRMGRESKAETGEKTAPEVADKMTMGASMMWSSSVTENETKFPRLPWAVQFTAESIQPDLSGGWNWETGLFWDQTTDTEKIRDHGLRAIYGHWSYMKNQITAPEWQKAVKNRKLTWVPWMTGKRESRRLLGDVILKEQDILERKEWDDASVTTTWPIDLHYPQELNSRYFKGEEFRTIAPSFPIQPYAIPYRCFYSRNVCNLFMAGRNLSVTHVALGTTRVMRTGGMMGEVVGMAAAVCRHQDCLPREVYTKYLPQLKEKMKKGIAPPPKAVKLHQRPKWLDSEKGLNYAANAKIAVSSTKEGYDAKYLNDGVWNLERNEKRWVSEQKKGDPIRTSWITYTFDQPVELNAIVVVTGQAKRGTPIEDFVLQFAKGGKYVDIQETYITGNTSTLFGIRFPAVKARSFRLLVLRSPGAIARIWETQLFRIPDEK